MKKLYNLLIKTLITIIITILLLIVLKVNPDIKPKVHYYLYEDSISFAQINKEYQKRFGSAIPFSDLIIKDKPVFNEKITYTDQSKYKDGVKLTVSDEYLIPNKKEGIVIFIGEKEDYGQTIIVSQNDGIDTWYGNIKSTNLKLYDYIEEGTSIGTCSKELYLVFKKDGKVLDYNDYL